VVVEARLAAGDGRAVIVGLGTDIISLKRIADVHQRQGQRFLDRVYTPEEQRYALELRDPSERLASRWAAKEACMKALGTGWAKGVSFTQIALLPGDDRGAPRLVLTGEALAAATRLGATRWHCSVSHSDGLAIATVILESL
jgi:holo-[acyl-carrier protein] synthase